MSATTEFRVPTGQRQVFLDDVGIETLTNLTRSLHQPDKKGAVIRSPDPSQTIQTRNSPSWDPQTELYKTWVIGMENSARQSPDGLHWQPGPKPVGDLGSVSMVVYDGRDPNPDRRFKAALLNSGFAASPDGITWTKLNVPAIESQDEGNFSYNEEEGLFIHTVKRGSDYGRSVAIATSTDFENWDDYGLVFHTDDLDQEIGREVIEARRASPLLQQTEYNTPEHYSIEIYNMGVFRYEGIYIGLPSIYHHTGKVPPEWPGFAKMNLSPYIRECIEKHGDYTGFYHIQVACSRDLKQWTRVAERRPFIETSPVDSGAYDLQTIIGPSNAVVRGDELWFYYTGIKQYAFISSGGQKGYDDYRSDCGAVCLAVLRRDGFVSLDAGDEEGTIVTSSFALEGNSLWVNADAPGGQLRVEVLDSDEKVLAASTTISGDVARAEVEWASGNWSECMGKAVRLRFTLKNCQLYSYWHQQSE